MSSFTDRVKNLVSSVRERDDASYKPVQMDEAAESRISLSTRHVGGRYTDDNAGVDSEASVGLLTRESDAIMEDEEEKAGQWRKPAKRSLCMCCGINLKKPFKILGAVALLVFIFVAYKLLAWAFYEPPAGVEGLPEFGTSLGCHSASYFYEDKKTLKVDAAIHPERFEHGVDFRGGAVGTIILTSSSTDSNNVQYEITLRSNDKDLLSRSSINMPALDSDGHLFNSMSTISTPYIPKDSPESCIRYDVKMIVPPSLKSLHLASHTLTHVKFDENAKIKLEDLFVTVFTSHPENIIQSSTSVKSNKMSLQLTRGWLVGDVAIVDRTNLITQRGDGVLHMDVYPEPPRDKQNPEMATLDTTTGAGRTNVAFHSNKGPKRPINGMHISSKNGPMEFSYKDSGFNGLVGLLAKDLKQTGMVKLDEGDVHEGEQQNYYVGNKEGKDKINVNSRAWVGLYF